MAEVYITKPAAAKRQIDAAIRILFSEEDPLAVHTVVAAAHGILIGLDKTYREHSVLADAYSHALNEVKKHLSDEELRQTLKGKDFTTWFQERRRRPANFLKHADRDPEMALNPATLETDHLLLEACALYTELGFELTPEMHAFGRWHLAVYPHEEGDRIETAKGAVDSFERTVQLQFGAFLLNYFLEHA